MLTPPLSVAVIGAGRWGTLHAQKLAGMDGVLVRQIVDPNMARARTTAEPIPGAHAVGSIDALMPGIQAVTIATPVEALGKVALACIARGLHVLCEKPLAASASEAHRILAAAKANPGHLNVGMIERFNPKLRARPEFEHHLELYRWGPGPTAACGLGLDWAIHDFDLARWLAREALEVVTAEHSARSLRVDLRTLDGRRITLDVRSGESTRRRVVRVDGLDIDIGQPGGDALADELVAFIRRVRTGEPGRLASVDDAICALELLESVQDRRFVAA